MKQSNVILVDTDDNQIGRMDKLLAHQQGKLHRAFSICIFNTRGEWLLQQRADTKYHSAGLWTNACCSHPHPGEATLNAANERLKFEMGLTCNLTKIFDFTYKADFDNGLTEYEYDHVFIGQTDIIPDPNPEEVKNWKYLSYDELESDLKQHPEKYTAWFKLIYAKVHPHFLMKFAAWEHK